VTVAPDGAQKVSHVPLRGRVAVKDALAEGSQLSSKVIWIARPAMKSSFTLLPVDWDGIASGMDSSTNHQMQPGDFLFVADEPAKGVARVTNAVAALFAPVE
jgi:polysaccharide biosynthesis/export protein